MNLAPRQVPPEELEGALIAYVEGQRTANSLEYGYAQVQWRQLSIIFCTVEDRELRDETVLFFGNKRMTFLPETFPLREHLLFVFYEESARLLYILGDLSLASYQNFYELGFISIGDIANRPTKMLYDAFPPEEQFISEARHFVNFYQPHFTHPDQVLEVVPLAKRLKTLQCTYDDVVFGPPRRKEPLPNENPDKEAERELSFYEIVIQRLLCQRRRNLGFYYGCLLSSLHSSFHKEYIIHEQSRLHVLLDLLFNTESKRIAFVQNWLQPEVQIVAPVLETQYFNRPSGFDILSQHSDLDQLQVRHRARYPNKPQPGVYFRAPLVSAPGLIEDPTLPVTNGFVSFTHYELAEFVDPMVERSIQIQVDYLRQQYSHYMLERHVGPMLMHYKFSRLPVHRVELAMKAANPKLDAAELDAISKRFRDELPGFLGSENILNTAVRFVASLDNVLSPVDRFAVWPKSRALLDMGAAFYSAHPELEILHKEPTPESYQDLLEYAERCWPPCMQKLAAGRVGTNHMTYEARLSMSAQLRRFGYSEKQGFEYWHLLFKETDVYREYGEHNFLESQQGLTIVYDYGRNKHGNTGVSCENAIGKGNCEFKDIEELSKACTCKEEKGPQFRCKCREHGCQALCKAKFSVLNPGYQLPYDVKSPRDYFFQARGALGPALYKKKE